MCRMFFILFLPSLVLFHVASEFFDPNNIDNYSNVYPFLEKWAKTSHTKMLTIVFDDYDSQQKFDLSFDFLNDLRVSTRLVSLKHLISLKYEHTNRDYQTIESGSCVLLLFSNMDHLRDIFSSPHMSSFWHPENVYLLREQRKQLSDTFNRERFCKWAFERLWRFRRVYKMLLFTENKVIRSDPFDYAEKLAKYHVNSSCDWYCSRSSEENFLIINEPNTTDVSDFFNEERRDFKSCPLKISIFKTSTMHLKGDKYSGVDFNYLKEICKRLNVTPVLVKSKDKYGWKEKGAFYGTIGHLVYEFADASFNQFFIKDYLTRQIEFSTFITSDKLCVLVPKAPPVPDYLIIVKIFAGEVWLVIFVVQFVISMIYTIIKSKRIKITVDGIRRSGRAFFCCEFPAESYFLEDQKEQSTVTLKETKKKQYGETCGLFPLDKMRNVQLTMKREKEKHWKRFNRAFLSQLTSVGKYLMRVVLQLMQPFQYGQPWFPERLLLMCSLFLSLILNGVVTSQLASSFSKRLYYEDINTLEELEESGLTILTNARDVIEDAFSDATSPVIKRLQKRLHYANESEVNRRLFDTKDAAFLHRLATISLKYSEQQRKRFHVLKECPKEYILSNIMIKGSPFRGRINGILGRLNNGGFYGKWYQGLLLSQKRATQHLHDSTMHRKITIRHLFIPFAILYVGLAASIVVFIYERRQNNVR